MDEGYVGVVLVVAVFTKERPRPIWTILAVLVGAREIEIAYVIIRHASRFDHSNLI